MDGRANPSKERQTHPTEYARLVVRDLLSPKGTPKHLRYGFLATTMWILSWLMPYVFWDWAYSKACELDKLKALLLRQQGAKEK
jgi:hypothetical protein